VLQQIEGRADAHVIQMTMLRSMNQAVYQPENNGHFGLAYAAYAHFTSPIRRYPDLLVHRAIRSVIRSKAESNRIKRAEKAKVLAKKNIYPYQMEDVLVLGEQCSLSERRADEASRDVVSWLKCEYLEDRVGEVFDGIITSAVSFGLFIELKDLYVEGLVHITSLPKDYYRHEPERNRLIGERTGQTFSMADEVVVRVVAVNLDERKIDFEIEQVKPGKRRRPSRRKVGAEAPVKQAPVKQAPIETGSKVVTTAELEADQTVVKKSKTKKANQKKTGGSKKTPPKAKSSVKKTSIKKKSAKKVSSKKKNVAKKTAPKKTGKRK